MGDLADVVAVLGALDREIARLSPDERAQAQARVADLVPPYGEPDAVGWYDRLLAQTDQEPAEQDLDHALERLARPPTRPSELPRRMAALGAVARAFPDLYGPDGSKRSVMLRALEAPGILSSAPAVGEPPDIDDVRRSRVRDDAERLLPALVEPPAGRVSFVELRDANRILLNDDLARSGPAFRSRFGLPIIDGDEDPVAKFTTRLRVTGMTLDDARRGFLDPTNWTRVEGWCEMVPIEVGPSASDPEPRADRRFLEVVGTNGCGPGSLEIAVGLDFDPLRALPGEDGNDLQLVQSFWMSTDQPQGANGTVRLDEGSISVLDEGTHLFVLSIKTLGFTNKVVGGQTLVGLAGPAGYTEMSAQFIEEASVDLGSDFRIERI
jgi:hypothetical protein